MSIPTQKVSQDDRYSLTDVTGLNSIEQTANHYLDSIIANEEEQEIVSLYRLWDDIINEEDYNYVLNPFNTKIEKYKRFRGKLRNFNIFAPIGEMMLSEFGRRNHYPNVVQSHPNDQNEKDKALNAMYSGYQGQKAVNALNALGIPTGQETVEQPPLEQAEEDFQRTYKDNRVISGQEALDYIIYDKHLSDKYIDLYKHYITCGRPVSYKGVNHDDIHFDIIHPLDYYFPHSLNNERLEDRDWGIRRWNMSPNQLLDYHRGFLSDELIKILEEADNNFGINNEIRKYSGYMYMSDDDFNGRYKQYYRGNENSVEHYHIVFKSFKRIAILTYLNTIGETKEMEVEDSYELDKEAGDIKLTYDYKNALYETYKVCINAHEEFIRTREIPYDRAAVNNSSEVKLPFNGLAITTIDGKIKSMAKDSINYQVTYNVLKYAKEKMINKNKDKIAIIPLGLINKGKNGWDEEKTMYYTESNSTLFVDETSAKFQQAIQALKVMDMSLGKYINEVDIMAENVKNEWWDRVGFNRQRYGETKSSDGKATNEQAIFRSSLITENFLRVFEKYQETDYAGLMDLSKYAWINGKKGQYVTTEGQRAVFEMNIDDVVNYLDSDMDVHVTFSGEENKKIEDLKGYMFNATQNGMSIKPVMEAMDTRSFTMMKEIINKEETARLELEQANKDADRENAQSIAQTNAASKTEENDTKKYVADKQMESAVAVKELEIGAKKTDEGDSLLEAITKEHDININEREQNRKEIETKSRIIKETAETKKLNKETSVITKESTNKNKTNN